MQVWKFTQSKELPTKEDPERKMQLTNSSGNSFTVPQTPAVRKLFKKHGNTFYAQARVTTSDPLAACVQVQVRNVVENQGW